MPRPSRAASARRPSISRKEKVSAVERGTDALLRQIATIGPHTRQWAEATTQARGVEAVRVLVGLKHLAGKHDSEALEEACRVALTHGAYRLRTIRQLLKRQGPGATAVRLPRRASDHSSPERLFARIFTSIPKGA